MVLYATDAAYIKAGCRWAIGKGDKRLGVRSSRVVGAQSREIHEKPVCTRNADPERINLPVGGTGNWKPWESSVGNYGR